MRKRLKQKRIYFDSVAASRFRCHRRRRRHRRRCKRALEQTSTGLEACITSQTPGRYRPYTLIYGETRGVQGHFKFYHLPQPPYFTISAKIYHLHSLQRQSCTIILI